MNSIASRLRYIRGNLSRDEFAEKIGVHKNTVGRYERGESEPDLTISSKICRIFNVDSDWLLFGKGIPPYVSDTESVQIFANKQQPNTTIFKEYGSYTDSEQQDILCLLERIVSNLAEEFEIPLSIDQKKAVANLYFHEMRDEIKRISEKVMQITS